MDSRAEDVALFHIPVGKSLPKCSVFAPGCPILERTVGLLWESTNWV